MLLWSPGAPPVPATTTTPVIIIIIIIIIIISNEFDLGGTVALLLQDHRTMLLWSVSRQFPNVKTGKFQVPAGTRRLMKQLRLVAAESSKPDLQPP